MLIRFAVSNFLSFDEEVEFNMLSDSFKTHKHHVYASKKLSLLKAAAIYGANGAGKSNLIKSIEFLKEIVSQGKITKSINTKKFRLNDLNKSKPSSFEIEILIEKKAYAYGLKINQNQILEEYLYESGVEKDDKIIFERRLLKSGKSIIKIADKYYKTQKQQLLLELMEENLLNSSELLLGKDKELKIKEISIVNEAIVDSIVIIHPGSKFQGLVTHLAMSEKFNAFANDLLKTFDTGVSDLGIETTDFDKYFGDDDEKIKNELIEDLKENKGILYDSVLVIKEEDKIVVKKVIAQHNGRDGKVIPFELEEESDGTQRLLDFIPAFDGILNYDMTFIIDEIDQSLHPALLRALVQKIMSNETTKGQFIFTTHESVLLDLEIFRQDEIWFVEKDKIKGSTQMYSLSEFKPRYDLDIRKGYLKGRFGAIPFLADLKDLKWKDDDAKEEGVQ